VCVIEPRFLACLRVRDGSRPDDVSSYSFAVARVDLEPGTTAAFFRERTIVGLEHFHPSLSDEPAAHAIERFQHSVLARIRKIVPHAAPLERGHDLAIDSCEHRATVGEKYLATGSRT
jgi:hypothetical protein